MIELRYLQLCLVEPSAVQAQIIRNELSKLGITRIDVAASGAEALARIRTVPPVDVLLSALYLPDMTGTELIYALRKEAENSDTPFILVSSETKPHYLDPIRQAGTIAILPKPFNQQQLQIAFNSTLSFLNADLEQEALGDLHLEDLKVLLVDDSGTARRHVRKLLEKMGFEHFVEAENGADAIFELQQNRFDLVVTDYNMPEMDGRELTDYIRKHSHQSTIPVLMVSSESNEERLAAVHEAGVSAICDKPFDTEHVRSLLAQMLGH
ncbi:response regulator [Andreprevotia chitinilytica]|uniref:response regulator n=1 Tax=Andreprevotia chitinilytica TaxID=396808 RepID=UPI0005578C93|nr:response regulator [Andreprevotia chitinilytica]